MNVRSSFQFRLSALLAVITGVALICAIWSQLYLPSDEDQAIDALVARGIFPGDATICSRSRNGSVVVLDLCYPAVSDEDLRYLKQLPNITTLNLLESGITDRGLEYVKCLAKLRYLTLQNTRVTDEGLKHLEKLRQLETITLYGTDVTDAGVARLRAAIPGVEIER